MAVTMLFFSSDVGRQALLDQQLRQVEWFGRQVSDARLQQMAPYAAYFCTAGSLMVLPLTALAIASVGFAVFNGVLGAGATFTPVFVVVSHFGALVAPQQLFVPLDYVRPSLTSPTSLVVVLPFLDESTSIARLLGAIGLPLIWWTVSLGIGFGVLCRRRAGPIALSMLAFYGAVALVITVVRSAVAGV